jgi:hypothetical protein
MARQAIDLGSAPNDGTGTSLRSGGDMINDNFTELYLSDNSIVRYVDAQNGDNSEDGLDWATAYSGGKASSRPLWR